MASSEYKVTADDVDEKLGHTVAQFKTDYPQKNGFKYMYNEGTLAEPVCFFLFF